MIENPQIVTFISYWETETKRANVLFSQNFLNKSFVIYQNLFDNCRQYIEKTISFDSPPNFQMLNCLLITSENICEIFVEKKDKIAEVKIQVINLDLLISAIAIISESSYRENILKLSRRAYFNYCNSVTGIESKFSEQIIQNILGDRARINQFFSAL